MAKRGSRKAGSRASKQTPGWVWLSIGLAIGLAVALAIYVTDRQPFPAAIVAPPPPVAPPPAPAPVPEKKAAPAPVPDPEPEPRITFDFYDMLPNLDVEVFTDKPTRRPEPTPPVRAPGIYILQTGSFSRVADANRRKAELALLGVRTEIKKGRAGDKDVYRVYTDPIESPDEVNRISSLLRSANVEYLAKRVSD